LDIRSTPVEVKSFRRYLGALAFNVTVTVATKVFDGVTFATKGMKEEVCTKFQLTSESMQVWHNGVDVDLFRPQAFEGKELRKRLGLSDEFIVFYHGAFREYGGIAETIKSIQILKRSYPNVTLFLLGAGIGLELYEDLIRESKIEDKVIIHKPVAYSEVPDYIAMADVGNQSPLKLIEYLAMGKTVIATDIPANRELIGDEKCGIYLSSVTPQTIAEAISYAYVNKRELDKWGATGRIIVEEEYDWRRLAKSLESYLNEFARY
jgi:glycosyltransferase involved in cell wall biosynthesis